MNKKEMIAAIAEESGTTKKDAEAVIDSLCKLVVSEVKAGRKVSLPGFGIFEISERKEREGINPKTKEKTIVPASKNLKFKVSSAVKKEFN